MAKIYKWWASVRPFDAERMAKDVTGDIAIHWLSNADLTAIYEKYGKE